MAYNRICISSGHGKHVQGAIGILNEHQEAVRVVDRLAIELRGRDVEVMTYEDTISTSQNENLNRLVDWHNAHTRDLDISVHFNAYVECDKPMGTEVLYVTQSALAGQMSLAIADAGDFINRGAKKRTDLFFLNNTEMPALLLEICFVDSTADADCYGSNFGEICAAIAGVLGGESEVVPPPDVDVLTGTCSWFGGPNDNGVSPSEGLAFIYDITPNNQWLFLPEQPPGTSGLARRLNPHTHYCAMRWDYSEYPKETLLSKFALVRNPRTGFALTCTPADWGPHEEQTGRLIDLSPQVMKDLDLETDDTVEVTFPYQE